MGLWGKEMRIPRLARAMVALVVFGLVPANATAQPASATKQTEVRQDIGTDAAVTCMAGCGGQAGQVLARPQLPPESGARPSGWRPVGQNNWCHDKLGCRTQYSEPDDSSRRARNYYSGGGCYSYGGQYVCY